MQEHATQLESGSTPEAGAKTHLLTMDDLDGRTTCVKKLREFETQIEADLGDDLTEAQKSLLRRAAIINAVLEHQEVSWADGNALRLTDYLSATNVLRRLLTTLGIQRQPKPANDSVLLGDI